MCTRFIVSAFPSPSRPYCESNSSIRLNRNANVPSNLTKGTSSGVCSAIIFGNFNDLIIGQWGGTDILVDPYTGSGSGTIRVVVFADVDVAVRHAESFSATQDYLTT